MTSPPASRRAATLRRVTTAEVTLARALSKLGLASRSVSRKLVREGRVTCGGRVVRNPDAWVALKKVVVALDGASAARSPRVYLMMHKPAGIVTTRSDEQGRRTVYDLLPEGTPWVFPVGRLDRDTAGLLLLTNDTRFGEAVTGAEGGIEKVYRVRLDRPLPRERIEEMRIGMELRRGERLRPVSVIPDRTGEPYTYRFVLREGKNRQIRRMCEESGCEVVALTRIAIGGLQLGGLTSGRIVPFDPKAVGLLRRERKKDAGRRQ